MCKNANKNSCTLFESLLIVDESSDCLVLKLMFDLSKLVQLTGPANEYRS